MGRRRYAIRLAVGRGRVRRTIWTCDCSQNYVRINADYSS